MMSAAEAPAKATVGGRESKGDGSGSEEGREPPTEGRGWGTGGNAMLPAPRGTKAAGGKGGKGMMGEATATAGDGRGKEAG